MREFLIISDVHGDRGRLRRILAASSSVTGVFFLGDGLRDVRALFSERGMPPLYAVRGNCDIGLEGDEEATVSLGSHRILMLHGHTAGAKEGDGGLLALARRHSADIVLYGHTHLRRETFLGKGEGGPLWLFNPGSVGHPYDSPPSFGRLSVNDRGEVLFGFGEIAEERP